MSPREWAEWKSFYNYNDLIAMPIQVSIDDNRN